MDITVIFFIAILIMSVVAHEVSHGFAAEKLGDPTARLAGRLSLNPVSHIDPIGSILVPAFLAISHAGFIFGWAKPVPYNPYNLKNQKWGPAIVAVAGPLANLFIALVFGLIIRSYGVALPSAFLDISIYIVFINILLAIFNLIPIPPLDGSKILFAFIPYKYTHMMDFLQRYSFFILLFIIFFAWGFIQPIISGLFTLITGITIPF